MIEKSLLFLPFYIAVVAAVELCFPGLDEYCNDRTLPILISMGALLLSSICLCCRYHRRRQQGLARTITTNQDQYLVLSGTSAAPGAGQSQPALARLQPLPPPPYSPHAAEYQPLHVGEATVQTPKAQTTSVPPPY